MPKRRLSISLRALLVLVLTFGLLLGWRVNKANRQREAVAAVKRHGGWVHYDWEFVNGKLAPGRTHPAPEWLRRALGDEYFQEIASVSFVYDDSSGKRYDNEDRSACDDALALLASQHGLKSLLMRGSQATDAGLAHLKGLTGLEDLYIWDSTQITDAGLEGLRGLVNLRNLHIDKSKVTDRGFLALKDLTKLEHLVLESHDFTDRGFVAVAGMKNLTWLCVGGSAGKPSHITDASLALVAGMKDLENIALPHSKVTDDGMAHLSGLTKLEILDLDGCKIGDDGLKPLSGLRNLKWLILGQSLVSDAGLPHLKDLTRLNLLNLSGSKVTEAGRDAFKKSMPALKIFN